jgi:putative ABC transport system permease protein
MRVPFTLLNLAHQPRRTVIAALGVAFAALLVFVQLGFLGCAEAAAVLLFHKLNYDVVLVAPEYMDLNRAGTFARTRLYQALADPDVAQVMPLYLSSSFWHILKPGDPARHGRRREMLVVGFNVSDQPLLLPEVRARAEALRELDTILIDKQSRAYFGALATGVETELGMTRVRVVGHFTLGTGFGADGMGLVSDETFARINGGRSLERVSLGLIRLRPGADAQMVTARLRQALLGSAPEAVRVFTRGALEARETRFWVRQTSLGLIFLTGVGVALLVGLVFVYQVISSDLTNRLGEFATLKAMGYSDRYLERTVVAQALTYAVLGLPLAVAAALLLYEWVEEKSRLPMPMPLSRIVVVLALTLLMCAASGLLALRRVKTLDPAELF